MDTEFTPKKQHIRYFQVVLHHCILPKQVVTYTQVFQLQPPIMHGQGANDCLSRCNLQPSSSLLRWHMSLTQSSKRQVSKFKSA